MYLYVTDKCLSASLHDIVNFMEHEYGNYYGNHAIYESTIITKHHVRMIIIFIEHGIYMILQSPNKPCVFMVLNVTFCAYSNHM